MSIWSALNSSVWVTPGNSEDGTMTIPKDTIIDESTGMRQSYFHLRMRTHPVDFVDLTPFSQTQETFWVSSNLKHTDGLGYTYPETKAQGILANTDNAVGDVARAVEELYGGSLQARLNEAAASANVVASAQPGALEASVWDWIVRIRVKEFELKESFDVLVFLGPVPENPDEWLTSESYVGCVSAFVNGVPERCGNCRAQGPNKVIQGAVYLDEAIAKRSGLPGRLDPAAVTPYLTDKLSWTVQKVCTPCSP